MVDPIQMSGFGTAPTTSDATGSQALGKNEFLRLLMTQLANQDPTEPQSSEQFIAQLAQFASLEANQMMSQQLDLLLMATAAQNQMNTSHLVGKDITFPTESISITDGQAEEVMLAIDGQVEQITIVIEDAQGREIAREVQTGPFSDPPISYRWNGQSADGLAADGQYTIRATASSAGGAAVDVKVLARRPVLGVSYASDVPLLILADQKIRLQDVYEVLGSESDAALAPLVAEETSP